MYEKKEIQRQLIKAIKEGNLDSVKEIIKNINFITFNDYLRRKEGQALSAPIQLAIEQKQNEIAIFLIHSGLEVNLQNGSFAGAPLHYCALYKNIIVAEELLKLPDIEINLKADVHETALFIASETGDANMVELLLKHNADPNIPNEYKRTPLHVNDGHDEDHFRITKALIQAGANIDVLDDEFNIPLSWFIAQKRNSESMALLMKEAGVTNHMSFSQFKIIIEDALENPSYEFHEAIESIYDELENDKKDLFNQHKFALLVG